MPGVNAIVAGGEVSSNANPVLNIIVISTLPFVGARVPVTTDPLLDTVNENVVPLYYNEMSTRQEMSPELKSYVQKRGQRMKEWLNDKKRKSSQNSQKRGI